jgi:putative thioredoxin
LIDRNGSSAMTILNFPKLGGAQRGAGNPGNPGNPNSAGSYPGAVIDVDERNFQQEVIERSHNTTVVIDFWAPWCGPCRTLGPTLEKLANEARGDWVLAKVNVDNNPRLAQAFGVQGIPAVKAVRDARLIDEFTGALPESQVRAWLKRFITEGASEVVEEDLNALEAHNPLLALERYQAVLAQNPQDDAARLGAGRLLVQARHPQGAELLREIKLGSAQYAQAQGWLAIAELTQALDDGDAFALIERSERDPADLEARYQLAAHLIAGRRYEEAIDHLLAIVARNRAFREDAGRKILLALFAALGDQHPLVPSGRRQLANLLF